MQKVSVMVCPSASGFKFPLVIVVPRKTPMKNFRAPDNTIVVYKPSGTFDSSLIAESFLKAEILRKNYDKAALENIILTQHKNYNLYEI